MPTSAVRLIWFVAAALAIAPREGPERVVGEPIGVALKEVELPPGLRLGFGVRGTIPKRGHEAPIGAQKHLLVDLDGDGSLREEADGIALLPFPFVVRLPKTLLCELGQCGVQLEGTRRLLLAPADLGLEAGLVAEAAEVNRVRFRAGLPLAVLDTERSRDCVKHCEFLKRNDLERAWKGGMVHFENKKLPGYTPEGERAGWDSAIFADVSSFRSAVTGWASTVWHATDMLDPRLASFGATLTHRVAMFYPRMGSEEPVAAPVPHPADGAVNIPRMFGDGGGEVPAPFADDRKLGAGCGYPLIVLVPESWHAAKIASFKLLDDRGNRVEGRHSAPSSPGQPRANPTNSGCAVFVPSKPLSGNRTFRARLEIEGHPPIEWSFSTGTS